MTAAMETTRQLILAQGYKLAEDALAEHGRLTFIHDDNADRPHLAALSHTLRYAGWQADDAVPPRYRLPGTRLIIEIEPGGSETSGHWLHLMDIAD
ncbi:hypothetical protein [Bradyrhizobium sp.]|uniref:hypothetical protein n=1 Tax=Bradyrhizobium sp. TaxID=376 RepID=UPI002618F5F3|nr:hypothetical protein [Bradyrhizobium sp.]